MMMDDSAHGLSAPATLEPISRPSSASTQASLAQLPGISALAMGTDVSGRSSPQPRPAIPAPTTTSMVGTSVSHANSSPAATSTGGSTGNLPICQNCATSTTPLWRRDEMGSVLCNACGLFLKLHGRPRPISLKTDVIKSRNRVKTSMRPDMAMKKKNAAAVSSAVGAGLDHNGVVDLQNQAYAATAALSARRTSQKSANGHLDGTDAALAGAASNMYATHASTGAYPMLDDGGQYQSQHLQAFGASGTSDGQAISGVNGDRLDGPQNQEQLLAANSSLKTRVAELEVINDFMQRRLGHYEPYASQDGQDSAHQAAEAQQLRSQVELLTQSETQLRSQIEESHRRENMLKRRLDELELELKEAKDSLSSYESGRAKRPRLASPAAAATTTTADASAADDTAAAATVAAAAAAAAVTAAVTEGNASEDAGAAQDKETADHVVNGDHAAAAEVAKEASETKAETEQAPETEEPSSAEQ